jgi:putative nucleotidyltransferase with HDIG domain
MMRSEESPMLKTAAIAAIDDALVRAVHPGRLFAVGGRVRDDVRAHLGQTPAPSKDLDYVVTGIDAPALEKRLRDLGRVDFVGSSFAVFKVSVDGLTVDVALPRREQSLGVGHRDFAVESGPHIALEDDLARRDFRMNMLARALPAGSLVDPYGGVDDIRHRRIDIVTPQSFREDPLRMLRAAQFAARFGYDLSDSARNAMRAAAPLAQAVSVERVAEELTKLLVHAPRPSVGIDLLRQTGVLEFIWPELLEGVDVAQNEWHAYPVYRHNLETMDAAAPGDLILRLAALLHDIGKPRTKDGAHFYRHEHVGAEMASAMLSRLRFSGETIATVSRLVAQHMYSADPALSDSALRRFIRRVGIEHLDRQFSLRAADIAGSGLPKRDDSNERFQDRVFAELGRKPPFSVKDLRIDGRAVAAALVDRGMANPGFNGDRRVGEALSFLLEQVTEQPERNEPDTLRALLGQYLDAQKNVS